MAKSRRGNGNVKKARIRTAKIMDRLTFSPRKHKRKETRKRLKALQDRSPSPVKPPDCSPNIKFGSININGMSVKTGWAVQEILRTREFDLRKFYY